MRSLNLIFILLLASVTLADAQVSRRRCEACERAGLSVPTARVRYRENDRGWIYFQFRNAGDFNWRVERVICEFFDRDNRLMYNHSFDLNRFEVTRRTPQLESDPYELPIVPRGIKMSCWIESATK
jgi:hypothetical protein